MPTFEFNFSVDGRGVVFVPGFICGRGYAVINCIEYKSYKFDNGKLSLNWTILTLAQWLDICESVMVLFEFQPSSLSVWEYLL